LCSNNRLKRNPVEFPIPLLGYDQNCAHGFIL
jgi:hypothetical protein